MKVGELRKFLNGVSDDLEIVVRAFDDDGSDYCGTIDVAGIELTCGGDDTPFLAIDCGPEDRDRKSISDR